MKNFKKGFTLIELLVVVAIIGTLASVVMASLNSSRTKSNDEAVKNNLLSAQKQAELYVLNNSYNYLPSGGVAITTPVTCPSSAALTNMLAGDPTILAAIKEAVLRGNGSSCYNSASAYAVAVGLKSNALLSWCVDSKGASKQVTKATAITAGGACN